MDPKGNLRFSVFLKRLRIWNFGTWYAWQLIMQQKPNPVSLEALSIDKYERELLTKKFQGFLATGNYIEAEKYFATYHSVSVVSQRMAQHFYGKSLMLQERHQDAVLVLEKAVNELGSHVGLLADLGLCTYVIEDFLAWRQWTFKLQRAFEENQNALSIESQLRTLVMLAKAAEEEGRLSVAAKYYRLAQEKSKAVGGRWEVLAQAQRLRLSAHYGLQENLGVFYAKLVSLVATQPDWDGQFEVQHALMTAEFRLVGKKVAAARLDKILKNDSWSAVDRNLMIFDFFELCLHTSQYDAQVDAKLLEYADLKDFKEFQKAASILKGEKLNLSDLLEMAQPHAGYIRLISMALKLEQCEDSLLSRKQLLLLLDSTDGDSREIWNRWLDLKKQDSAVQYSAKEKTLSYHDQTLSVKSSLAEWLELFKHSETIHFEDLSQKVWGLEYNESVFHRIRMQVRRINEKVRRQLGIPEIFSIENEKVKLVISLERKD